MGEATDPEARIVSLLEAVYGESAGDAKLPEKVFALIEQSKGRVPETAKSWSQRDALLITYADSIVGM